MSPDSLLPPVQIGAFPGASPGEAFDPELDAPLRLREALAQPVALFGRLVPLWGIVAIAVALIAVVARITARRTEPRPAAALPAVVSASLPTVEPPASSSAPEPPSRDDLLMRVSRGDPEAMRQVEARLAEGFTAEEAVALARGRVEREREKLNDLVARLRKDPPILKDPAVLAQLRAYAADPDYARGALAAMAALPGSVGTDLLYEVWTGTAGRTATTELAQQLLYTRDVRTKASPALGIALDLRAAETCEEYKAALPRAIADGDRRSLHLLRALVRRYGCGPNRREDCHECLRGDELLERAIAAVRDRPRPTY